MFAIVCRRVTNKRSNFAQAVSDGASGTDGGDNDGGLTLDGNGAGSSSMLLSSLRLVAVSGSGSLAIASSVQHSGLRARSFASETAPVALAGRGNAAPSTTAAQSHATVSITSSAGLSKRASTVLNEHVVQRASSALPACVTGSSTRGHLARAQSVGAATSSSSSRPTPAARRAPARAQVSASGSLSLTPAPPADASDDDSEPLSHRDEATRVSVPAATGLVRRGAPAVQHRGASASARGAAQAAHLVPC